MNRKGDLPTFMLFLVALILSVSALFSFVSFDDSFNENSDERNQILEEISFYEKYVVEDVKIISNNVIEQRKVIEQSKLKEIFQEEFKKRNYKISGLENYYGKILRGEFEFHRNENKYWFEINDIGLRRDSGASFIERKVNFRIDFDYNGDVISFKKGL